MFLVKKSGRTISLACVCSRRGQEDSWVLGPDQAQETNFSHGDERALRKRAIYGPVPVGRCPVLSIRRCHHSCGWTGGAWAIPSLRVSCCQVMLVFCFPMSCCHVQILYAVIQVRSARICLSATLTLRSGAHIYVDQLRADRLIACHPVSCCKW